MIGTPDAADNAISLESVLSTAEFSLRPSRPPDYETESRALIAIARHMADSPRSTLQKLSEIALEICRAGSAGVSLVSKKTGNFYWPAIAGVWKPHIGGGTPRTFGPCGVVLDRDAMQLFTHPERYYPYLAPVSPPIEEALLTPFHVNGEAVGTVWLIAHDAGRQFDAEDLRLIESLSRMAAAAYPLLAALDAQEQQAQSMRNVNEELLISSLRQQELTEQALEAEAALREHEGQLTSELTMTGQLQEISTRLVREQNPAALYGEILSTAMAIMHSDTASMQDLDSDDNSLRMLAFHGLDAEFARTVGLNGPDTETSCAAARKQGHRVIVPDTETCDFLAGTPELEDDHRTGIRATQSTPLIARDGRFMGIISTHWRTPHQPAERDLHLLDALARQTADLMERSQAMSALSESEERFRTLVDVITDVPWTADAAGAFVKSQPAWNAYTGQSWDEMRGFGWANALHPEDRAGILARWRHACQGRTLYRSEGRLWHAETRQYRHFQARATPLPLPDGGIREWVGTYTDVEEQRRAEVALKNVNTELKHFSYATSHDLQEPLRMVTSYTQLLARDYRGRLDPRADQIIAYAVSGATRMEALLRDLREYWSVSDKDARAVSVDCNQILEISLADLEASVGGSGAVVTHDPLPTVTADEVPLKLLFRNLIGNAIKYYRLGTPPRIHVSAQQHDGAWTISVRDNGIGIEAEYRKTIFQPFKRLHGGEYPGTGLGLAMCQKVVERYGGRIWVESTYGEGSTFYFTLPVQDGVA